MGVLQITNFGDQENKYFPQIVRYKLSMWFRDGVGPQPTLVKEIAAFSINIVAAAPTRNILYYKYILLEKHVQ